MRLRFFDKYNNRRQLIRHEFGRFELDEFADLKRVAPAGIEGIAPYEMTIKYRSRCDNANVFPL